MASPAGTIVSLTITGDWTNAQTVGSYIDCTGLTLTLNTNDSPYIGPFIVDGSSLVEGSYSFYEPNSATTITITANPSQFQTEGSQNVVFTASQSITIAEVSATKSVTVVPRTTTKNIYVFTADGRKAIWGTIKEQSSLTEVTIVNPNNSAVFYNIPEGTSVYLDEAGTQPVVACVTKITGTTVYMSGDGDCEYIYNDGIDYIMVGDYSVNKIDYSFLSARYADGSLTTCVETSYPVVSNQEA